MCIIYNALFRTFVKGLNTYKTIHFLTILKNIFN